jgi:hypothetical protein
MTCHVVRVNGSVAIACSSGRKKAGKCRFCDNAHTKLCDFEITLGRTCDQKICDWHATTVGPDRHYCPDHRAKEARHEG